MIYIVSLASIASRWGREELSVAKMREQEEQGCRVLPVLADDVDIPTSVRHIKYADFRSWRNAEHYSKAAQSLLRALGFEVPSFDEADLSFYNSHMTTVDYLYRTVFELQAFIDASMYAAQGAGPLSSHWSREASDALARWVVKEQIEAINFVELRRFSSLLRNADSANKPRKTLKVIADLRKLLKFIENERYIETI